MLVDRGQQRRELNVVPTQQVGEVVEPCGLSLATEDDAKRRAGGEAVQQSSPGHGGCRPAQAAAVVVETGGRWGVRVT